eukprot:gene4194-5965_t
MPKRKLLKLTEDIQLPQSSSDIDKKDAALAPTSRKRKEQKLKSPHSVKVKPLLEEKRLRKYRANPTIDITARIQRALTQRLYLVQQQDQSAEGNIHRLFAVLGSTGNIYDVNIRRLPSCNCPDCARGHLCKHIIFVMIKVLKLPSTSPLVFQNALLQSELQEIFVQYDTRKSQNNSSDNGVLARKEVIDMYSKISSSVNSTSDNNSNSADKLEEINFGLDVDCPICFDCMKDSVEPLEKCDTCHKYVHQDCIRRWIERSPSCVYCRGDWRKESLHSNDIGTGGYVNMAALQGISQTRPPPSYGRYRGYGYYGDDYYS